MATKKAADAGVSIEIQAPDIGILTARIVGSTPLIMNRMSQKVWFELLAPKGKKTAADKASNLKHDPLREFRASPYIIEDEDAPTFLGILPSSFKRAMCTAALDTPGAKKAQVGRLVYIEGGDYLPIWGIPKVFMSVTRSADMNRTPDIRTRAILPQWAAVVSVQFNQQILRQQSIANLLSAAGIQSGVGDWRQEKGSGSYGSFRLVGEDDPDFVRIVKTMGRSAQKKAMDKPVAYNNETQEMLSWFSQEVVDRGFELLDNGEVGRRKTSDAPVGIKTPRGKSKGNGAHVSQ